MFNKLLPASIAASMVVALAACASRPPPAGEDIDRARYAIQQAEQAGATQDAVQDLTLAQQKLREAEDANRAQKNTPPTAKDLAQQAELDAEVALARTRADQSEKAASELDKSLAALREQAQQPSPTPQ